MQLRHPRAEDIPAMGALWEQAFGEDPFCACFFETLFVPENSFVVLEGDKLCGMLHSVLYPVQTKERSLTGAYLYAAATAQEFRHRGVFRALHTALTETTSADFFFLIPENESVLPLYEHLGYQGAFHAPLVASLPEGAFPCEANDETLYRRYHESLREPCLWLDRASFRLTISDKHLFCTSEQDAPIYVETPHGYTSFCDIPGASEAFPTALARAKSGEQLPQIALAFLLN